MGSPHLRRAGIFSLIFGLAFEVAGQGTVAAGEQRAWADSVYASFENRPIPDAAAALPVLDSVFRVMRARKDTCRMARVGSWRGQCFDMLGRLDSAIAVGQQAMNSFRPHCDSIVLMSINVNMSNALLSLGEFERVRTICESALAVWSDAWPYSIARNGLYTNRAIAMANLGDMPGALEAFRDVLRNARKERILQNEADALNNLGALFGMMSDNGKIAAFLDSSALYQSRALAVSRTLEDLDGVLNLYLNLAILARDREQWNRSLLYLDSAQVLADRLDQLDKSVQIEEVRSTCFFRMGRSDSAYVHLRRHLALKDTLLNTEKVKAIADMQEKYESEKKAKEILGLKAENLEGELAQARVKRTRNIYMFVGIGVLALAGGLWNRLRFVHRSRAAIQKEKDISEGLLHNILPEEVADELKAKGYADVKEFDQATILFTDFKGFTQMSEKLSAADLVAEIDHCFKAFDGIMEKYRIEKIKTIGDAYMAAGGLPIPEHGEPADVVLAALEMQAFMGSYKAERISQGRLYFEMRVGLHTGTVVAGIVGVKKFAYDIWGDTVNIASRMESSGEVGKVNISEATYALVKDTSGLRFTPRGKVQAKGKGEMEMYFVDPA